MNRFVALDSWRGICACLVAFMHFDAYSHFHILPFVWNFYLFVDFFFVMCGFVIFANYQERLLRGFGVGRFMLLRFGRLYPLHLFMLACFIGFELIRVALSSLSGIVEPPPVTSSEQSIPATVANILLTHGLGIFDSLTWNRPSWSISTEFYTYLVFALSLIWIRKRGWLAVVMVMLVSPIVIASVSDHGMNTTFDYGFIRCLYGFTAGIVAFRIYDCYLRDQRRMTNRSMATIAEIISLISVVVFIFFAGRSAISVIAPYVFMTPVILFSVERGFVSVVMKQRSLTVLGTLSYSIYMVHLFIQSRLMEVGQLVGKWSGIPVLTYVDAEQKSLLGTELWHGDLLHLAMLPVVIAVSYMTYQFVEEPTRAWFRTASGRLFGRKRISNETLRTLAPVRLCDPRQVR